MKTKNHFFAILLMFSIAAVNAQAQEFIGYLDLLTFNTKATFVQGTITHSF